jgi:hypothetical protein
MWQKRGSQASLPQGQARVIVSQNIVYLTHSDCISANSAQAAHQLRSVGFGDCGEKGTYRLHVLAQLIG